ncbi:DUF4190 domain-containing protein [Citricoccus sp.]|uniref:DUF4190 domain-containing protein n=1 Tax=Citricoccus sp. TaxID=1978372 RepID=UPI0028BD41A6|nr:DUF4190 domain-containing protein [Citricoccus sp.]
MSDRDPHQHGGQSSEGDRPFNDPHHPSWYSDPSAPAAPAAPRQSPGHEAAARNPYADQPLAGPYGNGQGQYPIQGEYPVLANPSGGRTAPGQNPPSGQGGAGHPYGPRPGHTGPWDASGRQAGSPFPVAGHPAQPSGLAVASMVLGIVGVVTGGFLFVPQILAVILGHVSLNRDRQSRGFAIAGLVMGYLMIGLMLLGVLGLMALLSV